MLIKSDCDLNTDNNVSIYYVSNSDSKINNNIDADLNETECLL